MRCSSAASGAAADALSCPPADALVQAIRESAAENSLLILITDRDGEILASADEHSALYTRAHDASTGSGPTAPAKR